VKKPKTRILFVCTGNACRSQMAEGFARALKGKVIEAYSAGTNPHPVLPETIEVMRESGVDISSQRPKHVLDMKHLTFDYVVTLCDHARESCPLYPGATKTIHHGFDDPPFLAAGARTREEALAPYRRVRDEIKAFVLTLPKSLQQA
jgi:arsenate reductase (thioredoxin)